jgi:putative ABC transport system substrate-binding protein
LGWTDGRNIQVDYRWSAGDSDNMRKYAAELVALAPDVLVASGTASVAPLLRATRTVPIVFAQVTDPVGAGFVDSLARPGGNATGFTLFEYGISGKWLELHKEIAPAVTRVAVIRDPDLSAGTGQFGAIQSVAPSVGVEVSPVNVRDASEIERTVSAFVRSPPGGLIVTASSLSFVHRALIISLAARHKLPAVYYRKVYVTEPAWQDRGWSQRHRSRARARYGRAGREGPGLIKACPWCATPFSRESFACIPTEREPRNMQIRCANPACVFTGTRSLPILTVDGGAVSTPPPRCMSRRATLDRR